MKLTHTMMGTSLATVLLLLPGAAQAGRLATGAVFRGIDQGLILCFATNVGEKPVAEVTVALIDLNGSVLATHSCAPLAPSATCQTSSTSQTAHCQIDFKGPKKSVRGSIAVNSSSGNNLEAIEPAR